MIIIMDGVQHRSYADMGDYCIRHSGEFHGRIVDCVLLLMLPILRHCGSLLTANISIGTTCTPLRLLTANISISTTAKQTTRMKTTRNTKIERITM